MSTTESTPWARIDADTREGAGGGGADVTRTRVPRPAGFNRVRWDESLHECGHAVMAFCLGTSVFHVCLSNEATVCSYTTYDKRRLSLGGWALVKVAGAAAERSKGKGSARMSSSDGAGLDYLKGRERQRILAFAEDFFRVPEVAALLDRGARFLYARFGGVIPGADILAAVGEKHDLYVSFPEAVDAPAESLVNEVDSLLDSRHRNEVDSWAPVEARTPRWGMGERPPPTFGKDSSDHESRCEEEYANA